MKKASFVISVVLALFLASCTTGAYKKTDQGIIVSVQQVQEKAPKLVRLQVMGEKIIHVSATAEDKFADPQSLIIVPQADKASYIVEENGDTIVLVTKCLRANVLTSTGEVWFTDPSGNLILQEQKGGGKLFQPYQVIQTQANGEDKTYDGWSIQTLFESPSDEAFYGLGQHQADDWNYKGKNEELFQYNTKVSVPFVVSNKNYGILLDSYSLCRFGNPNDYEQLNKIFTLFDKEGKEGALTGTYSSPEEKVLVRREDSIYFENLKSAKNLPQYPLAKATVVYEGEIVPQATGEYRFLHYYSGYQKIYIDGKSVYTENVAGKGEEQEIWRTAWNPNARKFNVNLEAGKHYNIRIEWKPDGGEAYCGLRALAPVAEEVQQKLSIWSEMTPQLDYYFMAGENLDEVISGYRSLTGKAQIMPKWVLGYWQSRERYKTSDELLTALAGFRSRQLPIDNIVEDWSYWPVESWGSHEFDKERFPDPQAMVDSVHAQHAKIMISCWPKFYPTTDNFKELNEKGYMYQQSLKDSLVDWIWPGYHYGFYDAYAPEARKIFWRQMYEKLGVLGMDAWWMDASEPNVRDCTDLRYRKDLCGPTYLGSSDQYFNTYSIVNAEAIYDGQRATESGMTDWNQNGYGNKFSPENRRVFLLTRSGFPGLQRYSTATWSGDIGTRWEDMKAQITAGLNFSISGIPFWSQDIGGFSVEGRYSAAQEIFNRTGVENADLKEWRELNARWHQFGAFAPMYRSHGQFPFREPWNIAPENHPAYKSIQYYLNLRYRMMPYLYSLAAMVHYNDYTMMRPLVMDFGADANVLNIGYQFMLGPSLMVNPIYVYGARQREVYFPKDNIWYDFYTGEVISKGGETKMVSAPYERIPLYVRAGAILPYGPSMQYSDEKPAENIRLYVYEGANGQFTLYEDENVNYGYEAGRFARIPVSYNEETKTLTIGDREGNFPGMLQERTFTVIPVSATKTQSYDPDAAGTEVKYNGKKVEVKL